MSTINSFNGTNSVSGLVSGVNSAQIVNALIAVAAQPQQQLQAQKTADQTEIRALQTLNTGMQAVYNDALQLALPVGWQVFAASSSDSSVATASATSGAQPGSLTFTVANLATSSSLVSSAAVGSPSTTVTSGNLLLSQAAGLGFSGVAGDQVLSAGSHTLTVSQATTGATVTGTSGLSGSTTITAGVNDSLTYTLDGTTKTVQIAAGTYSADNLARAVAAATNGDVTGSVNGSNQLVLASTAGGSTQTLTVDSGSALATMGMSSGASASGTDGSVSLDGGPAVTVTDTSATATPLTLTSPNGGTVTVSFAGQQLTAGSSTLTNVSTAGGTLSDVVGAINGAGAGMTATAVQVGSSGYRLQITSGTTGAASGLTLAPGSFAGTLGSLDVLQAGQDASITVGSGSNAYQITSASNTVTGVLPGVTVNLLEASSTPVTVSVTTDSAALSKSVQSMVDDINSVLGNVRSDVAYNSDTKTAGPLLGDGLVEGLAGGLISALTSEVPGSTLQDASAIGITMNKDGTIAFDSSKFQGALARNPSAVQQLFTQSGTGIAQHLQAYADSVSNPTTGLVNSEINGAQATIQSLTDQIANWQIILDMQRQALMNEFNQMESTLSQLQAQSKAFGAATTSKGS